MEKPLRLKLRLEFEGSGFGGWQLQSEAIENQFPSVQGTLESALAKVLRRSGRVPVQGCGRTDAGVHAEEFFCHLDLDWDECLASVDGEASAPAASALERFRHKVNCVLPEGVVIQLAEFAPGFHATEDARAKTYEYRLLLRRAKPVMARGRCWWLPIEPFNEEIFSLRALESALRMIEGKHDFKAFAAANASAKTTVREILRAELRSDPFQGDAASGQWLRLRFTGTGFLKQMVRNLVGTLVEVAQKKRSPESVRALLDGPGDRTQAGPCAVPEGLFLMKVDYGHVG